MKKSYVIWFTGLSGAGKTTLANLLHQDFENFDIKNQYLDGDDLRKFFNDDMGYNEKDRIATILARLNKGQHVALVSDAGTPNIADPGALLVSELRREGIQIVPIPGPSSITSLYGYVSEIESSSKSNASHLTVDLTFFAPLATCNNPL